MALDTQKEYQDEIDKTKKHFESGEKLLKDLNKKLSETQGSIKATETLMDLQEKKIDKLYKEGSSKGFKLKRAKELVAEIRALETQDDYQDKIDDLMKEVEKLYDEGTDLGFKLKRGEQMDFEKRKHSILADLTDLEARKQDVLAGLEYRALNTEKDYQKEIDRLTKRADKIYDELDNKVWDEVKKWQKKQAELEADLKEIDGMIKTLAKDAKAKGFTVKTRSQEIDFEVRALGTQKAYQKEIDKYNEKLKELQDDFDRYYTDAAIKKHLKSYLESMESQFLRAEEKGKQECLREIEKYKKIIEQLYKDAKSKGFDVKK